MAPTIGLPWLAAGALIAISLLKYLIYPIFLSPLSKIPAAHPLARISSLWMLSIRYRFCENSTIHAAHQRLGPVILLGPNEISVNCVKGGILTVYSGGFEKGDWYDLFTNFGGVRNMFSMPTSKQHSARKRMLANTYSKSNLQSSPVMASITEKLLHERLLPQLEAEAEFSAPFNIYAMFSAITMDFVTCYIFGLESGSNLMQDAGFRTHFLDLYDRRRSYNFWPQEMPVLTSFLKRIGITMTPEWVNEANRELEDWVLSMCDRAATFLVRTKATHPEALSPGEMGNFPVVYSQLQSAMGKSASKEGIVQDTKRQRLEVASEVMDQLAAGFDTSGITLTYLVHELSQRPDLQSSLRKELLTLKPLVSLDTSPNLPSAKSLDSLPVLNAIVDETLRLRAAIPGPEPRITPPGGCTLGPNGEYNNVPGGMRISAQAHSLHRNEQVFHRPNEWLPERYLDANEEKLKEMRRWFWAFGSGGRMCVGSNLALQEMKFIVGAIYTNFTTHVVDDAGIEQLDIYTAPPKSGKLFVRLERAAVVL